MAHSKKKKRIEPDDPEQFARFIKASEQMEMVDNPKEAFEQGCKTIIKSKTKRDKS